CDPYCRGAIGQRRRVARGQATSTAQPIEGWRQARQLLHRCIIPRDRVTLDHTNRYDQVVKETLVACRDHPLMPFERPGVLSFTAYAPFLCRVLRMLSHALARRTVDDGWDVKANIAPI